MASDLDSPPLISSVGSRRGRARKDQLRRIGRRDLPQYQIALTKLLGVHQLRYATRLPSLSPSTASSSSSSSSSLSNGLEDTVAWLSGKPGIDPAEGHLCHERRARRKRQQVANLLLPCNLYLQQLLAHTHTSTPLTVVEFCCGSGHVALPLAALYPSVHFILMDTRPASIHQAQERAAAAQLTNVECMCKDIFAFSPTQPFHLGIALHACGPLTDVTMDLCLGQRAAFVVCPCCIGNISKTSSKKSSTLEYPRSTRFRAVFPGRDRRQYEALASAADVSVRQFSASVGENEKTQHRRRRLCKSFVESDRALRAEEAGYQTHLMLLTPRECTPKNDLLFGHPKEWVVGGDGGGESSTAVHVVKGDDDAVGFDAFFGDPVAAAEEEEEEEEEKDEDEEPHGM